MAGEHQRHHLVADLAVGEGLAVLAAGGDEQAEDVLAARVGGGAAAADLLVDDPVEDTAGGDHLAPGRAGAAQQAQGEVDAEVAERLLEFLKTYGDLKNDFAYAGTERAGITWNRDDASARASCVQPGSR